MINPRFARSFILSIAFCHLASCGAYAQAQQDRRQLVLDADTANEIDDMYAITRLLKQSRFEVIALTSTQWIHYLAEDASVAASQRENEALVQLLGKSNLPTPIGSREPMRKPWGGDEPKDSPAAQFIINAATHDPSSRPKDIEQLWENR